MAENFNKRITSRNIVIFGQSGAGKSSVINMLGASPVAKDSGGANGCTSLNQSYCIPHGTDNGYTFWDTPGLNEAKDGTVSPEDAVQNLLSLVRDHDVNLLIYCIRGRLVDIIRVNYDLFWRIICKGEVPIMLVVTGLEGEVNMDDWWDKNEKTIKKMKMKFRGHACITSWKGRNNSNEEQYNESAVKVWKLVRECCTPKPWHMPREWPDQAQMKIDEYETHYKARSENKLLSLLRKLFSSRKTKSS